MSTDPGVSPALSPAAFVLRGLLAGLVAGLLAFVVAFAVGEPAVDDAIALEESAAQLTPAQATATEEAMPAEEDHGMVEVSRAHQKSWGLLTGMLAIGAALGGLTALAAAAAVGRLGRLGARASTAVVVLAGFVAVSLVPFLKYPATPPAVGDGATIGHRTSSYFALLLVSVLTAIATVVLVRRLLTRFDGFTSVVLGAGAYGAVVTVTALLLPTVNELGDFPADVLWSFRVSALFTLAALWAGIGVVLVPLVGALYDRAEAVQERKALAASL